ncbi:MAG: hypothetical protein QNJ47_21295 [Nostocaceae cyanobacterium]|nr:hypothetical protein [Nostocaceae cyanobacterium]
MHRIIHILKSITFREYLHIFIFFWAIFALINQGFIVGEGGYHYRLAEHIVKSGQLGFDTPQSGVFITAPNGKVYAGHEIGNTLFMLPTAFLNVTIERILSNKINPETIFNLKNFIFSFQFSTYSALTCTAFLAILRQGFNHKFTISFLSTCCLSFTTYFVAYSRNSFDGVLCTTLLTASFLFLILYRQNIKIGYLIAAFALLGISFITRISMVLPIVASMTYLFLIHKSFPTKLFKSLSIAIATQIPFFIWQIWYNHLRTGIFYKSPVQTERYISNNGLDGNIFLGLSGLLFSPGKSLFVYAPLLVISLILFKKFYREHRKEAIYIIILTVLWFLLHAKLRSWYGAWGWGPRHFVTILPILFIPFAVNFEYIITKTKLRIFSLLLASFGFILSLSSIISNWHFRIMYAKEQGRLSDSIFVWGFWNSQSIDMLKAACGNIWRLLTAAPAITLHSSYSKSNEYVSSTLNIWANALLSVGIPWYIVSILVIILLCLLYFSIRNLLEISRSQFAARKNPVGE